MNGVVLLSRDPEIRDRVLEMAAVADVPVEVAHSFGEVRAGRRGLTLLDERLLAESGGAVSDECSEGDLVLLAGRTDAEIWQSAADVGADRVVMLPEGWAWLRGRLADLADPGEGRAGRTVCVVGARGGCGATTIAAALAHAAAESGAKTILVDGDPDGSGLDLALGLEASEGLRWPDLIGISTRLPSSALDERFPVAGPVAVLSHSVGRQVAGAAAWQPTLSTLRRSFDVVVVDLPRYRVQRTGVPAGSFLVLVATLELAAAATARALIDGPLDGIPGVTAVRTASGPLSVAALREALGSPRIVAIPRSRAVVGAADYGDLMTAVRAGGLGRATGELLASLWPRATAA